MKKLFIGAAITVGCVLLFSLFIASHTARQSSLSARPAPLAQPTPTPPVLPLNPVGYHSQLEADYLAMINEVNHNYYNYVTTKIKKSKGGYTLWAYHSFFGQYEFEIGNFGKEVSAWIARNRYTLKAAKITRVGVHGTGPYASYTYYEIQ